MIETKHARIREGRERVILLVLWVLLLILAVSATSVDARPPAPDVALWLARSCVGEAGFKSYQTGECAAIAHIYKKRAERSGASYYSAMREYSAAIKPAANTQNPWIFGLNREGTRPRNFPRHLNWAGAYRDYWVYMLEHADRLIAGGMIPDPLPEADHYGGWIDRHRIPKHWERIHAPEFRNRFYTVPRRTQCPTD